MGTSSPLYRVPTCTIRFTLVTDLFRAIGILGSDPHLRDIYQVSGGGNEFVLPKSELARLRDVLPPFKESV